MMSIERDTSASSSDQVEDLVRKLNMTYDDAFQWTNKKAQKQHTDLFGDTVQQGERYWRMRMGGSFSNDLKLTDASMRRFLFALFSPRPNWEREVEKKLATQMDTVRSIMDNVLRREDRTSP